MESKAEKKQGTMTAAGSSIIQVQGDFSVTHVLLHRSAAESDAEAGSELTKLSQDQRVNLAILADEVVQAESGLVSSKIVRAALNSHLGVKGVAFMTTEMFGRATQFLKGWKACAAGKDLSPEAIIVQILRMWAIVPGLRGTTTDFTRATFQREMLKGMSTWELRTALAFSMTRWQAYWEQRNA